MHTAIKHPRHARTDWKNSYLASGIPVAVGLVSVVAFLPVLANGFADQWDDQTNFLYNQSFRGLGWSHVRWALTTTLQGAY